mmetsp:Transcript_5308/g.12791  ORF Transcript_5308/g.12791 Transcript_5308/m.12791 type:complete len:219 (-) Transcript_5308:65-721(-)
MSSPSGSQSLGGGPAPSPRRPGAGCGSRGRCLSPCGTSVSRSCLSPPRGWRPSRGGPRGVRRCYSLRFRYRNRAVPPGPRGSGRRIQRGSTGAAERPPRLPSPWAPRGASQRIRRRLRLLAVSAAPCFAFGSRCAAPPKLSPRCSPSRARARCCRGVTPASPLAPRSTVRRTFFSGASFARRQGARASVDRCPNLRRRRSSLCRAVAGTARPGPWRGG